VIAIPPKGGMAFFMVSPVGCIALIVQNRRSDDKMSGDHSKYFLDNEVEYGERNLSQLL